jgi:DNA-binding NarL/FixJ family response regulator
VAIVSPQEVVARGLTAMLADYPSRVVVTALPGVWSAAVGVEVILYDTLGLALDDGAALDHLLTGTDARVLIYSREARPGPRALPPCRAGATWVSMSTGAEELIAAIESVLDGTAVPDQPAPPGREVGLTPREAETLALVTRGLSNHEIAEKLCVSANTLKSHIRQAYRKIGAASRAQAVAWAMGHGFTPD